ncbi:MAG: CPBP family intramembrane glutamic endopeptidase [Terracidiphilus sp.]|jgi:membrane protease YdiL (CAAX protease family)
MEPPAALPHASEQLVAQPVFRRSKRRAAIEIAVAYALIIMVEWTPRPLQRVLWMVAALGLALIVWRSFDGWQAMGFRAANFGRSLWIAAAALVLAAVAIVVAVRMHTVLAPGGALAFFANYCAYAVWAGVQQFLLQGVFLLRFLRLIARPAGAALAASVLFSTAHLPNPVLTPITFIWGFAACLLFLRYRNIFPLMIAHAILGITVAMTIPGPVDHNMRVGLGYLRYDPHQHVHRTHRQ